MLCSFFNYLHIQIFHHFLCMSNGISVKLVGPRSSFVYSSYSLVCVKEAARLSVGGPTACRVSLGSKTCSFHPWSNLSWDINMKVQDSSRFDNSFWVSFSAFVPFKYLELVTIKNEILEVPNLKLVFLTFERSEIWQNLKNKKKRRPSQLYRGSNPDHLIHRQLCLPLYHKHLLEWSNGEKRRHCNFCQISLLSKVRKTSLRLGTFKISFLIVTNSSESSG